MPVVLSDSASGSGTGNVIVNVTIPTTAINRKLIAVVDQYVVGGAATSPHVYYQSSSYQYTLAASQQYDAVDEYTHLISIYYYDAPAVGTIQTIIATGTKPIKAQIYALENAAAGVPDYQIETGEAITDSVDTSDGDMVICGAVADPPLGKTIYQYLDTVLLSYGGIGNSDFAFGYKSFPGETTIYGFQWVLA
jgi:hypothetical protein